MPAGRKPVPVFDRISSKLSSSLRGTPIEQLPSAICWGWEGSINIRNFTPFLKLGGREKNPRRILFEELIGPVPVGQRLNARCGNIMCVNPHHTYSASGYVQPETDEEEFARLCEEEDPVLSAAEYIQYQDARWNLTPEQLVALNDTYDLDTYAEAQVLRAKERW